MIEGIPLSVGDFSAVAILTLVVLMIITGKGLATRREVDAEKDRADSWREAFETERAASREKDGQLLELLEQSRTTVKLLEALPSSQGGGTG